MRAFVLSRADRHGWPRKSHRRAMTIRFVVSPTLHIALLHTDVSAAMGPQRAELKAAKVEAPINVKLEEEGASVALVFSVVAPVATSSLAMPAAAKEAAAAPSSLSAAFAPSTSFAVHATIAVASAIDVPPSSTEELESEKVDVCLRRR